MDLTQIAPRSPHFYKTVSGVCVTAIGTMLLIIMALQFSDFTSWRDRLVLGMITVGIGAIGFAYFKQHCVLNQMDGTISDGVVLRLRHAANAMAGSGYMICIFALGFVRHH